jgi:hypothetical protein
MLTGHWRLSLASHYIKQFDRTNYKTIELLQLWWKDKTHANLGTDVMTDFGFICFNSEDRPIVAIFLYPVAGCQMAMIGFPIANPNVFRDERQEALSLLVAGVEKEAKRMQYTYLVSYAGSKGAGELFNRENYKVADQSVTQFVKRL